MLDEVDDYEELLEEITIGQAKHFVESSKQILGGYLKRPVTLMEWITLMAGSVVYMEEYFDDIAGKGNFEALVQASKLGGIKRENIIKKNTALHAKLKVATEALETIADDNKFGTMPHPTRAKVCLEALESIK